MNSAATRAAIKRASQQARNAMQQLDGQSVDELLKIYSDAMLEVKAAIRDRVDANDMVPQAALKDLLRQIEDIVDTLGQRRDALLADKLTQAADLGVRPYTLPGVAATGRPGQAVLTSVAAMTVSQEAVAFVQSFTAADGLRLSDRVWRLDQGAKEALSRSIGRAVVAGWDASRASAQFMYSGQAVPLDVKARLAGAKGDELVRQADLLVGDGGEVWKADRVFRTEINRAHGTAYMAGAEKTPGFVGFRFLLSPRHPKPDVCLRRGTLVTTRRGLVPIESVVVGDLALTHLGRWRPVVKLYRSASGQNGLVRLCFPAGHSHTQPVVMTPNHPVLTPQGWTPAGDLRTGSAVVCLATEAPWQLQPCGAGAGRTASPDSGETASAAGAKTADLARCDASSQLSRGTARNGAAGWLLPTGLPMIGAAMRLLFGSRPSKPGYLAQCAAQTAIAETAPNAETGRGGACQSSGYQRPTWAHTQCSSIFANGCTRLGQTALRMWGTSVAWLRGLGHNMRWCSTHWPVPAFSTAGPETQRHSLGTWLALACRAPSTEPHTHDCKTAWKPFASRAPIGQRSVSAVYRSVRKVLGFSCSNHISFATHHTIVDKLPASGEDVFNLEVADDHSYIAAGVVVHNCDLLSAQNLYGLGKGVYPDARRCPWPAHPNTLSFVEMVFDNEITAADKAGKETPMQAMARLPADVRDGVLGKTKATYFDQGLLGQGAIRSPLKAVDARLERQGSLPGQSSPHRDALANYQNAVIPMDKLTGYSLNPDHPKGADKARVFASALGITSADAQLLANQIHAGLPYHPAKERETTRFGTKFMVDVPVKGPSGNATVTTGWIYLVGGTGAPNLTTVYVKKK